jgi:hypothetical protein
MDKVKKILPCIRVLLSLLIACAITYALRHFLLTPLVSLGRAITVIGFFCGLLWICLSGSLCLLGEVRKHQAAQGQRSWYRNPVLMLCATGTSLSTLLIWLLIVPSWIGNSSFSLPKVIIMILSFFLANIPWIVFLTLSVRAKNG